MQTAKLTAFKEREKEGRSEEKMEGGGGGGGGGEVQVGNVGGPKPRAIVKCSLSVIYNGKLASHLCCYQRLRPPRCWTTRLSLRRVHDLHTIHA